MIACAGVVPRALLMGRPHRCEDDFRGITGTPTLGARGLNEVLEVTQGPVASAAD